jgi:hypothetical protein
MGILPASGTRALHAAAPGAHLFTPIPRLRASSGERAFGPEQIGSSQTRSPERSLRDSKTPESHN